MLLWKYNMKEKNPIWWKNDKCVICKILLKIDRLGAETPDDEMSYGNFLFVLKINFWETFIQSNN